MANPSSRKTNPIDAEEPMEAPGAADTRTRRQRIEPDQIKEWAERLNVSTTRLREALQRAGPVVDDVKRFLSHH
ncbi:MAG TPA: DUF3606 domain-containing protein [Longimicrobiales bacterium]